MNHLFTWLHQRDLPGLPCGVVPIHSLFWRKWALPSEASCPPRSRGRIGPRSEAGSTRRGSSTPGSRPCPAAGRPYWPCPILRQREAELCCAEKKKLFAYLHVFFLIMLIVSFWPFLFLPNVLIFKLLLLSLRCYLSSNELGDQFRNKT